MTEFTLESLFGDEKIEVDCPSCDLEFYISFKDVMNDKSIVQCPGCRQDIEFVHDETTKNTLTNSDKALKKFDKSLKELNKTFKKFGK